MTVFILLAVMCMIEFSVFCGVFCVKQCFAFDDSNGGSLTSSHSFVVGVN